jgi:hypothetical protein
MKVNPKLTSARAVARIRGLRERGASLQEIATIYSVSREAVRHRLAQTGGDPWVRGRGGKDGRDKVFVMENFAEIQARASEVGVSQAARELKLPASTLRSAGVTATLKRGAMQRKYVFDIEDAVRRYQAGESPYDIGRSIDVPPNVVSARLSRELRKRGLPVRSKSEAIQLAISRGKMTGPRKREDP